MDHHSLLHSISVLESQRPDDLNTCASKDWCTPQVKFLWSSYHLHQWTNSFRVREPSWSITSYMDGLRNIFCLIHYLKNLLKYTRESFLRYRLAWSSWYKQGWLWTLDPFASISPVLRLQAWPTDTLVLALCQQLSVRREAWTHQVFPGLSRMVSVGDLRRTTRAQHTQVIF